MSYRFAAGKIALGLCDRCGFQFKLHDLNKEVTKGRITGLKVCDECLDPDHPQNFLGEQEIRDPQALREPRPDSAELDASRQLTGEQYDDWVKKVP